MVDPPPRQPTGTCEVLTTNGDIVVDTQCMMKLAGQSKRRIVNPPPRQPSGPCEVLDSNGDIIVDSQCMSNLSGKRQSDYPLPHMPRIIYQRK